MGAYGWGRRRWSGDPTRAGGAGSGLSPRRTKAEEANPGAPEQRRLRRIPLALGGLELRRGRVGVRDHVVEAPLQAHGRLPLRGGGRL